MVIEPGIVAGGHVAGADRIGVVEQPAELEPGVAPHAGVGRPAAAILGGEVVDDPLEVGGEVERIERNAEPVGHPPGVEGVGGTAAALMAGRRASTTGTAAGAAGQGRLAVPHEHAHAVVALLDQQGCGHARIDAAAHGDDDPGHERAEGPGEQPWRSWPWQS